MSDDKPSVISKIKENVGNFAKKNPYLAGFGAVAAVTGAGVAAAAGLGALTPVFSSASSAMSAIGSFAGNFMSGSANAITAVSAGLIAAAGTLASVVTGGLIKKSAEREGGGVSTAANTITESQSVEVGTPTRSNFREQLAAKEVGASAGRGM